VCKENHERQSEEWNTEHEGLRSDERKIQGKYADKVARTQQEKVQARGIINTKADEMVLEWKGRRANELVNLKTKTRLRREELKKMFDKGIMAVVMRWKTGLEAWCRNRCYSHTDGRENLWRGQANNKSPRSRDMGTIHGTIETTSTWNNQFLGPNPGNTVQCGWDACVLGSIIWNSARENQNPGSRESCLVTPIAP